MTGSTPGHPHTPPPPSSMVSASRPTDPRISFSSAPTGYPLEIHQHIHIHLAIYTYIYIELSIVIILVSLFNASSP